MMFWILSPLILGAALGVVLVRRAVHAALLLAIVMICIAMLYAGLAAPFLFAVQIVVYTGAILMLFLFVLMLVGVDVADDIRESILGHRTASIAGSLALASSVIWAIARSRPGTAHGAHDGASNVRDVALLLFGPYVIAFEATSALLIAAAIGAMVLAHRERLVPRPGQAELARRRLAAFSATGGGLGQGPLPGTYATGNSVDMPVLLADSDTATGGDRSALDRGPTS